MQTATFTDLFTSDSAYQYSARVNWGDGTPASSGAIGGSSGSFDISATHTYDCYGSYSIGIIVTDSDQGKTVGIGSASVANVSPIAVDDEHSMIHDRQLQTTLASPPRGVLANDLDSCYQLTASVVTDPQHGTLTLQSDGTFTYTPAPGFVGDDSFGYFASDGWAGDLATATIDVTNVAPVVVDDTYSVIHDRTLIVQLRTSAAIRRKRQFFLQGV